MMKEAVLQIFQDADGQFGGRIFRDGSEDGRVEGFPSRVDVEIHAIEAGIDVDRVEVLDRIPPLE